MKERDREYVRYLKADELHNSYNPPKRLLTIIDRLDKQLTEIKEAGKFLDELVRLADKDDKADDDYWLMDHYGGHISEVEIGQIRRLADALKEE